MARWRLTQPHYMPVLGTEWEYKETTKEGRQHRRMFAVPLHLDPDNAADWNYKDIGIVVFLEGSEGTKGPHDYIFVGQPTPDMEPLDDQAMAISKELEPTWRHPIETIEGPGYSHNILTKLEEMLAAVMKNNPIPKADAVQAPPDLLAQMQAQVEAVLKQNAELAARVNELEGQKGAAPTAKPEGRRSVG